MYIQNSSKEPGILRFNWQSAGLALLLVGLLAGIYELTTRGGPATRGASLKDGPLRGQVQPVQYAQGTDYRPALMLIPAGRFVMGSRREEAHRREGEDQHPVTLTRRFLLMATEVTQGQYQALMHDNPAETRTDSIHNTCKSAGLGLDHPVYCVDFLEAATFANRLSEAEHLPSCYVIAGGDVNWPKGLDCPGYRLPTEAEWEYAARGGGATRYGVTESLEEISWYDRNSAGQTHPVGTKKPNPWGLFDMTGNVWEWVWDRYAPHQRQAAQDPTGAATGTTRVYHGGSWGYGADYHRLAFRGGDVPGFRFQHLGFRLARSLQ
jgi:formylglycine-generating enzyme required for sulfatase activity